MVKSSQVLLSTAKTSMLPYFADIFGFSPSPEPSCRPRRPQRGRQKRALRILFLFGGAAGVPAAETTTTPTTQRRNTSVTAHQRCYHNGNPTRPVCAPLPSLIQRRPPRTASQPLQPRRPGLGGYRFGHSRGGRQTPRCSRVPAGQTQPGWHGRSAEQSSAGGSGAAQLGWQGLRQETYCAPVGQRR